MTARTLIVGTLVALVLGAVAATRAEADVTFYGGGSVPPTTTEPVPLVLVLVERGRVKVVGFSGGACSNGRPGFGRFLSHSARLSRRGRFRMTGSFAFTIPGGVARGSYRVRGTVRARSGVATGTISVRVRFPAMSGKPITCRGLNRMFRARNPNVGSTGRTRGPFYGVTSQGLPILIRPSPDSTVLAPVELWTELSCKAFGRVQPIQRLTIPTTAPGLYAKTGHTTGSFTPALGSPLAIPMGTYTYTPFGFAAQIVNGQVTGTVAMSSKVGNAQKQLVDTCASAPITFTAVP
jgi:hypothetical protein